MDGVHFLIWVFPTKEDSSEDREETSNKLQRSELQRVRRERDN